MALPAALQWEFREDGNNDNGSGYSDLGGASVDYTQQAAAELSLSDLQDWPASKGDGFGVIVILIQFYQLMEFQQLQQQQFSFLPEFKFKLLILLLVRQRSGL